MRLRTEGRLGKEVDRSRKRNYIKLITYGIEIQSLVRISKVYLKNFQLNLVINHVIERKTQISFLKIFQ